MFRFPGEGFSTETEWSAEAAALGSMRHRFWGATNRRTPQLPSRWPYGWGGGESVIGLGSRVTRVIQKLQRNPSVLTEHHF